ncbi:LysR family transcriptional regulator [Ruegeria arenilitoris]|uniref:LysR family transcriptional regulator n=1 Tax=Ruegeria arenilitoris TaxID=1173585 RepID=UPI00147A1437|nr:LysR family transcriptional regulator [Ruegeria arenilitoris]
MFTHNQLKVFSAIMQTGSVSAAGRRLNLSQPSVSRLLSDLEREFGVPLFRRRSKGVTPLPEAEEFYQEVERNFLALANLDEVATQIARKDRGSLSIATITAASLDIVPQALKRLNIAEKNIRIDWRVRSSNWILDYARFGAMRTGFAYVSRSLKEMNILYEGSLPHVCFVPEGHPLSADQGALKLDQMAPYQIIGLRNEVESALSLSDLPVGEHPPVTVETSLAALTLCKTCGGLPVVDAFTACHWWKGNKGQPRIVEDLPLYRFAVVEPIGINASQIDRDFQDCLIEEIERVVSWIKRLREKN